jgi:hypothetical protein
MSVTARSDEFPFSGEFLRCASYRLKLLIINIMNKKG